MEPQMPELLQLPSERMAQLRNLSRNRDITISDLIGEYVNDQITKGNLEADLPGFKIERIGDSVSIDTGDWTKTIPASTAETLGYAISAILKPGKNNPFMPLPGIDLVRRGTSIKIVDLDTGKEKTISRGIAADLASLFYKAST